MPIKIAMIGAGSDRLHPPADARHPVRPRAAGRHVRLHRHHRAQPGHGRRSCAGATSRPTGCRPRSIATTRPPRGHRGRRLCDQHGPRIGGLEAFQLDIDIPLKYGVDQCVGDTLCAGGIMYGQRNIPRILDFCKDIREVAKPGALFLNYANPNGHEHLGLPTSTAASAPSACATACRAGTGRSPASSSCWANEGKACSRADEKLHRKEVDIICAGINHQTWYIQVRTWRGMDMGRLLASCSRRTPCTRQTEKVRIDMLQRFGYYSTESNGHLSEYVPWYRKRPDEITRWIDLSSWINGETGGYLRVCTEGRNWFETDFPNWLKEPAWDMQPRQAQRRARHLHHRGAGDRPRLPRPLQRGQPRLHHQPARRMHRRGARLRGPQRHQHPRGRRPAAGLRGGLHRHRARAAAGGRGGRARRRRRCSSRP